MRKNNCNFAQNIKTLVMVKILLATLLGTLVYFLFGWLIFEGILGQYMSENTTKVEGFRKDEANSSTLMLVISCTAYALLLSLFFGQWSAVYVFKEGALKGAMIGMLIAVMTNAYWYSSTHFFNGIKPLITDVLAAGLTVGLMGGVIAAFLGYWER
jgi:hypothetical protein